MENIVLIQYQFCVLMGDPLSVFVVVFLSSPYVIFFTFCLCIFKYLKTWREKFILFISTLLYTFAYLVGLLIQWDSPYHPMCDNVLITTKNAFPQKEFVYLTSLILAYDITEYYSNDTKEDKLKTYLASLITTVLLIFWFWYYFMCSFLQCILSYLFMIILTLIFNYIIYKLYKIYE